MKNKTDNILTIQKYTTSKIGTLVMLIATVVLFVCYIVSLYVLALDNIDEKIIIIFSILKDILLSGLSIIGTSLLTTVFIEKNKKNVDYTELIANDIFASPEFYSNLTDENKKKMHKYLEEYIYHKSPIKSEIYSQCRKKIHMNKERYFYNYFNINVSYFKYNGYSEKVINRVVKLRTYDENIEVENLFLFSYQLSPTEKVKNFELLSVQIGEDNEFLDLDKDIFIEKEITRDSLSNKCGYTDTYNVYLRKRIEIQNDKDIILSMQYISRVCDEDMSMGFGVSVPCREFYLNFIAPSDMIVYAHPYGFLNTENNYPNSLYKNNISIHFNNWLLPGEGVAICLSEKRLVNGIIDNQQSNCEDLILEKSYIKDLVGDC